MSDIEVIGRALFVLAIPFMFGIVVGVEIVNRRKEVRENEEACFGRLIRELIDQTTDPLRFTGPGVRVTRQIIVNGTATKCKVTFEAGEV